MPLTTSSTAIAQDDQGRLVMDVPGYPYMFELDEGESHSIRRIYNGKTVERTIKVVSIKHYFEPNFWFSEDVAQETYSKAEIVLDVSGKKATVWHRPYQMPIIINGLRVYVETTKNWAENAEINDLNDIQKQVRISVCAEEESWGPETLVFPIENYSWRSAAYNNTWSSLVPYNKLYYHRGEDYGAIPDKLNVVAPMDGEILATPLPDGDGQSNAIFIENQDGIIVRMSHMNIETVQKENTVGEKVRAGAVLAKTGMTWDGRKSQVNDPHFHIEFIYKNSKLGSYPYLVEAYLRTYPDSVLAIAGGYQFTTVDREIVLDGSRSLSRMGGDIKSYTWKLHNGEEIYSSSTSHKYDQPGLYTEELIVKTKNGSEDRDFVQIRVYDKGDNKNLAYGWAYYFPVRDINVGTEVLFWNRLIGTNGPVIIDFGDSAEKQIINKELTHTYKKKGNYVVELTTLDKDNNPVSLKLEVKVK